jgi:CDP-diacylglycerol--glycerol-3-phosphate 3-phosphatidyltransferase
MNLYSMQSSWKHNLPMILTYSRAALAPVILAVLMSGWSWSGWASAILFILAGLTDWADGFFARRFKVESNMGKLMDPISDKILVLSAIVMLLAMGRVDPVMVFLFLARDIFIGGIRSVAAANNIVIDAKPFGKWKTALQMLAIPCLLVYEPVFKMPIADFGYYALWVSVSLSLISGGEYTRGYYRQRLSL